MARPGGRLECGRGAVEGAPQEKQSTGLSRLIYITGLFDMPPHAEELRPSHLVSIIQREFQPQRPSAVAAENHLRVAVHDVAEADGWSVVPASEDVARLIRFLRGWEAAGDNLLVHCYAGVSRSTAAALIAWVVAGGAPESSARALRDAAPHAMPNPLIVRLADEQLGLAGRLIRACSLLGPSGVQLNAEVLACLPLAEVGDGLSGRS